MDPLNETASVPAELVAEIRAAFECLTSSTESAAEWVEEAADDDGK